MSLSKAIKRAGRQALAVLGRCTSPLDRFFLGNDIPLSNAVSHRNYHNYLQSSCNKKGFRILEVGSREVTGVSRARARFCNAEYLGFDFYPGANVDVVGDAHKLSSYFQPQSFDLIYSASCFEHFAMPWVVATEIGKLLKIGGLVFVETHFSYSAHERPWNFFQFSDMGLRVLFSKPLGFECIEAGMSNPIVGRFSSLADKSLRFQPVPGLYCHSEYLGRKIRHVDNFDWSSAEVQELVDNTVYPAPK